VNYAHVCELKSHLIHQVLVEYLERDLFIVLNQELGNQQKLNPLSCVNFVRD